jgi:hypothetical protein
MMDFELGKLSDASESSPDPSDKLSDVSECQSSTQADIPMRRTL